VRNRGETEQFQGCLHEEHSKVSSSTYRVGANEALARREDNYRARVDKDGKAFVPQQGVDTDLGGGVVM